MAKKLVTKQPKKPPLKLVYAKASSITGNPENWRTHPDGQLAALSEAINDESIGFAGALLYNEKTKRLIDGHARLEITDGDEFLPVLVGSWTPEAERKILLTLDTITNGAGIDPDALRTLLDSVEFEPGPLNDLVADLAARIAESNEPEAEPSEKDVPEILAVQVQCKNENHQQEVYNKLKKQGLKVKLLSL